MRTTALSIEEYIATLPEEKKDAFLQLSKTVEKNIPKGFVPTFQYGMITYVVPHSLYPAGYHCDPKLALPFLSLAVQKNFIALYHMGIYADESLLDWFVSEYPKHASHKLDMGKSCIRFKKTDEIPFKLIAELVKKMNAKDWIKLYESKFINSRAKKK